MAKLLDGPSGTEKADAAPSLPQPTRPLSRQEVAQLDQVDPAVRQTWTESELIARIANAAKLQAMADALPPGDGTKLHAARFDELNRPGAKASKKASRKAKKAERAELVKTATALRKRLTASNYMAPPVEVAALWTVLDDLESEIKKGG